MSSKEREHEGLEIFAVSFRRTKNRRADDG